MLGRVPRCSLSGICYVLMVQESPKARLSVCYSPKATSEVYLSQCPEKGLRPGHHLLKA